MSDPLFDGPGNDPELDALENELSGYRFDSPPPDLPAKRSSEPKPARREAPLPDVMRTSGASFSLRGKAPLFVSLALALVAGVVSYSAVKKKEMDVRKGWNLVPVVVAAVDVSEGTVVTMEMISQRSIPEQFVTSSVVKPDSVGYIVDQQLLVPGGAVEDRVGGGDEADPAHRERGQLELEQRVAVLVDVCLGVFFVHAFEKRRVEGSDLLQVSPFPF